MHTILMRLSAVVAVFVAVALCGTPTRAQAPAPRSVTIIIPERYPAFRPLAEQPDSRAREVRAVVLRGDLAGADSSVILVNPAHLDPETLRDALAALQRMLTHPSGEPQGRLAAIGVGHPSRPVDPGAARALNGVLAELRARPAVEFRRLATAGRSVVLADFPKYLPARP